MFGNLKGILFRFRNREKINGKLYCRAKKQQFFRLRRAKKKGNSHNSHIKLYFRAKIAPERAKKIWGENV